MELIMSKFKIGDRVRLNNGWTEMKVFTVRGYFIEARYLNNQHIENSLRHEDHFVYWDENTSNKPNQNEHKYEPKENTIMLYQVKDTEDYGTFLTTNSVGQMILEMKGTNGGVKAFDKDLLTEVTPYTFMVKGLADMSYNAHYTGAEGKFKKGDILISETGNMYCVEKLDTKSKTSKGDFKGRRLVTEEI